MSQHDYVLENQSGASFRADINNALAAIATNNSGATFPTTTFGGMWHVNSDGVVYQRSADNTTWLRRFDSIEQSVLATSIKLGNSVTPSQNFVISVPSVPDGTLTITRGDGTSVASIDVNGILHNPAMPVFSAYNSTAQTLAAGVATKLNFDTENYDTAANFSSSKFTATIPGYYQFHNTTLISAGTPTNIAISFYKNGTLFRTLQQFSAGPAIFSASCMIPLAAGDYVEIYATNSSAWNVGNGDPKYSDFSGFLISPM